MSVVPTPSHTNVPQIVVTTVVRRSYGEGKGPLTRDINVFIGAFTTAQARLELYDLMDGLGLSVLKMDTAENIILFFFLLKGVCCKDFSISLPNKIQALSGSCVIIECRFEIHDAYDKNLTETTTTGLWMKDGIDINKHKVFTSRDPKPDHFSGKITGKLHEKNCTTVFYNVTSKHNGQYYFRIMISERMKYTYGTNSSTINVIELAPKPTVQLYVERKEVQDLEEVLEGSSVSLRCSAETLCSSPPPTLTWSSTPRIPLSDSSRLQELILISDLNFTATRRQHRVTFTCTITYQLQDENKTAHNNIDLHVQYAPKISNSSSCIRTDVTVCFCEVDGNPSSKLEWHLSGRSVTNSSNTFISEERLSSTGLRSSITLHQSLTQTATLQCLNLFSVLIGVPGVALVVVVLCAITCICVRLSTKQRAQNEASGTYAFLQLSAPPSEYETLNIKRESAPKPTVQLFVEQKEVQDQEEVLEGSSVSLRCSAETLCSSPPPTLTWSPTPRIPLSDSSRLQELILISDLNFTATHHQHRVTFTCTITYQLQDENKTAHNNISLHVQYAPKISNSSSCIRTDVTVCFCEVDGNPSSKLEWHLSGRSVTNSSNTFISEERLSSTDLRSSITLHQSLTQTATLQCVSNNSHGNTSQLFQLPSSVACLNLFSVLIGVAGVALVVVLSVITCICVRLSTKQRAQNEAAGTYAFLQLSAPPSEYETLNIKRGVCCRSFNISLTNKIEALSGSCVIIECRFEIEDKYDKNFTETTATGLWFKDGTEENTHKVFTSRDPKPNHFNGNITGKLHEKNCTIVFYNVTSKHNGQYYFRIMSGEDLKYTYRNSSTINVIESAPKPTVQLNVEQKEVQDQEEVLEGSSVSLRCSAETLCSSPPPTLTWSSTPRIPLIESSRLQELILISDLNFTATRRQHRVTFTCTITYQLQDKNKTAHNNISLHVQYAPKISNSSSCIGTNVIVCFCEVDGNPSPKLEWHLSGRPVTNSSNTFISEERLSSTGLRSSITLHQSLTHTSTLQCVSNNTHGTASQLIQLSSSVARLNLFSVLIGVAGVALVVVLLSAITCICVRLSSKQRAQNEAAGTYAFLQLSAPPSEYETLNIKRGDTK
ncbi:hypothetical protein QQF64_035539 [Cirrhinus molitorella]|uniref:Ig-like domain-containing protein n=1 Tax=Cirrhinus molitorella TaxID=172907 RepID=A0ABR3NGS2_9TELE